MRVRGGFALGLALAGLAGCAKYIQPMPEGFLPPVGSLVAGYRETAAHRIPEGSPPAVSRTAWGVVSPREIGLWLHVSAEGHVMEVRGDTSPAYVAAQVREVAKGLRFEPFLRAGVRSEAWVQEKVVLATPERPPRQVSTPVSGESGDFSIRLERSGCVGVCPEYSVTVSGDGAVRYRGSRFVSMTGSDAAQIDPVCARSLLHRFRAANFFGLGDSYRAEAVGWPTIKLTLSVAGRSKTVSDYAGEWVGMPAEVTALEQAVDETAGSARWVSAGAGTLEAMKTAGIGAKSAQGEAILRAAAAAGTPEVVAGLLAGGASIPSGETLIALALQATNAANREQTLKVLLEDPRIRNDRAGMQAGLAAAMRRGDGVAARTLISAGADPDAEFEGGETYLMLAAGSGRWAMLEDALARSHEVNARDAAGRTALDLAAWEAPEAEDIFPIIDRLLAAGAEKEQLDEVLLETCEPARIRGLAARGGNLNVRDTKGATPLFQACPAEGVQAMLTAGADPALRDLAGETALEAAYDGREDARAAVIRRFVAGGR